MGKSLTFYAVSTAAVGVAGLSLYGYVQYQNKLRKQHQEEIARLKLEVQESTSSLWKVWLGLGFVTFLTGSGFYIKNKLSKK